MMQEEGGDFSEWPGLERPSHECDENATRCPGCGGERIAVIQYGYPAFSPELQREIDAGRIALGGCCITDDMPTRRCNDCDATWGRLKLDG